MYSLTSLFNAIPLSFLVSLGFYFAAGTYILFTAILYYHWNEYSVDPIVSKLTGIVYLAITLPLMAIMAIVTTTI
jgi:hypothetical protein